MTTQVTIRNDHGHDIVVTTFDISRDKPETIKGSEYFLTSGEQVQLYVWKDHYIKIEEGEEK